MLLTPILLRIRFLAIECRAYCFSSLLFFQIDGLVGVGGDSGADLHGSLAELCLLVSAKTLFSAGGALSAVGSFKTTAQAGVAEVPVAAAVAGKLIDYVPHLGGLLVNMGLPGIGKVFAGKPGSGDDGWKFGDLERRRGVVRRHIIGGVGELRVTGHGSGGYGKPQKPLLLEELLHERPSSTDFRRRHGGFAGAKKNGTNVLLFVPGGQ